MLVYEQTDPRRTHSCKVATAGGEIFHYMFFDSVLNTCMYYLLWEKRHIYKTNQQQ